MQRNSESVLDRAAKFRGLVNRLVDPMEDDDKEAGEKLLEFVMKRLAMSYEAYALATRGIAEHIAVQGHLVNNMIQYMIDLGTQLVTDLGNLVTPLAWPVPIDRFKSQLLSVGSQVIAVRAGKIGDNLHVLVSKAHDLLTVME
jgi:hypothetical protein